MDNATTGFGYINFIAGDHNLHAKPFMVLNYNTVGRFWWERFDRHD